jgi:glycosyltransferase involved in cell wall biosynthesis
MRDTVIVIPCYNEAERLPAEEFRTFASGSERVRFLFVNDGSTDGTATRLEALCDGAGAELSWIDLPRNGGKAEAVRQGLWRAMEDSTVRYAGFWDADLATPLGEIPGFIQVLDDDPRKEMVFGSRVNLIGRNVRRNTMRHYIGRVFATLACWTVELTIYDTQCGAKLFRVSERTRELVADRFLSRWIFDVEILARLVQARRGDELPPPSEVVYELPLHNWYDVKGSKLKPSDVFTVMGDLVRIRRRYFHG